MRWLLVLRCRLRSLFLSGRVEHDLDRELAYHIEARAGELRAEGMSAHEARNAALREFGSVASVAEQCRDTRRVSRISNLARDLRYAVRTLGAQPMLVFAASSSIALGVGANLFVFGLANELLLSRPTAHRPDRLVHIRTGNGSHVSFPAWREFASSGALTGIAGHDIEGEMNWRGPQVSTTLTPLLVTANYFDVVRVPFAMGRGFTAAEAAVEREPRVVVISHGFWTRHLGADPSAIGSAITLNGEPFTVLGVLPASNRSLPGYGLSPDLWVPISRLVRPDLERQRGTHVQLVGRLHDGQTADDARAALQVMASRVAADFNDKEVGFVRRVEPVGSLGQVRELREVAAFFAMLLVLTLLVLGIACANVAGLLLARGTLRAQEIALRFALGAGRGRIIQQLLVEGLLLCVLGTMAAFGVAALMGLAATRVTLPVPVPLQLRLSFDDRVLALAAMLTVVSTLLCSLVPALQTARPSLTPALRRGHEPRVHRRLSLRTVLVTGQVAMAVLLLAITALFVRNLGLAHSLDPGFDTRQTLVAQVTFADGRPPAALDDLAAGVAALPGVESVAFTAGLPLTLLSGSWNGTDMRIQGMPAPVRVEYAGNQVGPAYFRTMGIPVEQGREFARTDAPGAPSAVIVNREFARRYLADGAVGRQLYITRDRSQVLATVVGVVGDSKYRSIGEATLPALYETYVRDGGRSQRVRMVIRSAQPPEALVDTVRTALLSLDSSAAVSVEPMRTALADAFLPSRLGAMVVGALGTLGTLLAMIGLYALVSFAVSRRTAEIGVRMALGATRGSVTRLVLSESAVLVVVGIVAGLGLAAVVTQPLRAFFVSGLRTADPVALTGTAVLLATVSLVAAWLPARRAARVDPVTAIRVE